MPKVKAERNELPKKKPRTRVTMKNGKVELVTMNGAKRPSYTRDSVMRHPAIGTLRNRSVNVIDISKIESSFEKNHKLFINALKKLAAISNLKDNWNDNGAKRFENILLVKCFTILSTLEKFPPEIFPVADGSIQFEFEKEDGSYLEFDIFENEASEFVVYSGGKEVEKTIACDKIAKEVKFFYERTGE
ncbi:MAG: hypothetical protein NC299_09250 [Lachnospiraceae bacterium]|nr:hypothetical protein [Ruminococcus sp.]MCM1275539.1 hypothetical protein [Lachnospiraceae bacterium]